MKKPDFDQCNGRGMAEPPAGVGRREGAAAARPSRTGSVRSRSRRAYQRSARLRLRRPKYVESLERAQRKSASVGTRPLRKMPDSGRTRWPMLAAASGWDMPRSMRRSTCWDSDRPSRRARCSICFRVARGSRTAITAPFMSSNVCGLHRSVKSRCRDSPRRDAARARAHATLCQRTARGQANPCKCSPIRVAWAAEGSPWTTSAWVLRSADTCASASRASYLPRYLDHGRAARAHATRCQLIPRCACHPAPARCTMLGRH